jgi:hypothetical protein
VTTRQGYWAMSTRFIWRSGSNGGLIPRDAQRDCFKKAIVYESAPQAISVLSLSWLSGSWTFRFTAENTNATRKDLEPLHLRGTSRGASRGKSPSLVLRRSECFLHRSLPSFKRRVRYAHLTGSAVLLLTPPAWSALPPPRLGVVQSRSPLQPPAPS